MKANIMLFSYAPYPIFLRHDVGCSEMSRVLAFRVTRKGWFYQGVSDGTHSHSTR